MPLLLLSLLALAVALVVGRIAWWGYRWSFVPTLAIGGGVVFAVLLLLVLTNAHLLGLDKGVAGWAHAHASTFSTHGLSAITHLGSIYTVVVLCVVLAVVETIVERSIWVVPFIAAVIVGEEILVHAVKQLTDRARPTFNPVATTLGPSFPSGHSATAAAFYATAALLIGRRLARPWRALFIGLAAGIAVAVAASRVLLDVHWLTDAIAGLALGWMWFALCAIAFGAVASTVGKAVPEREERAF